MFRKVRLSTIKRRETFAYRGRVYVKMNFMTDGKSQCLMLRKWLPVVFENVKVRRVQVKFKVKRG